jgi:hypothetical protein
LSSDGKKQSFDGPQESAASCVSAQLFLKAVISTLGSLHPSPELFTSEPLLLIQDSGEATKTKTRFALSISTVTKSVFRCVVGGAD